MFKFLSGETTCHDANETPTCMNSPSVEPKSDSASWYRKPGMSSTCSPISAIRTTMTNCRCRSSSGETVVPWREEASPNVCDGDDGCPLALAKPSACG